MSDTAKLLASIGGALSAQATGGSAGLQQFMATLAQQQAQQSAQDFKREAMDREQSFTLHRDRLQRQHEEKLQAAQLKQKQTLGIEADTERTVNYLTQAAAFAQAQGGAAHAQWQGFENSLRAGGYLPDGVPIDYSTPEGAALLKSGIATYVGNVGPDLARSSFGQTKEAAERRQGVHWQMFGRQAPSGYTSEQEIKDSQNFQVAQMQVGKATDELTQIRGRIDNLEVTENDTAESLHARLLPIAQEYAGLLVTLRDMEGVYASNEVGQLVREADTIYTPFLSGATPLGKEYSALNLRAADLRTIIETKREALKSQVYSQRNIGQTGELMVNVAGWGGAKDADGNPTEMSERMGYFSGPIYQRENAQYKNGVNALVNLSEEEAKAQGLFSLWQQYQAATAQNGEPLYDELSYWANLQFAGSPQDQAMATDAIKGVFNLNPDRVRARADIHRGNKADLEAAAAGFNSLNLDVGHTLIEEDEISSIRDSHGIDVKVADGLGGEEVVRRIVDPKETIKRWAADPKTNAVERLAVAALETTPTAISEDADFTLDRDLLDHRIDMMADKFGIDNTRTTRIKDTAWSLYNSGRDFSLSNNPLAADVPTAATPRLNIYKSVLETPAGISSGATLTDLLSPSEQEKILNDEYAWLSDNYSVDRGPELVKNLRASAAKGAAAVTQAKSFKWNPFGAPDSESVELGVQTAGNTDFSLQELLGAYNENGASPLFKGFLTTPGNAYSRSDAMVDRAYQSTERLSFAVQYKKQQDRAGVVVDNQVYNRLALLDAMRGQKDPAEGVAAKVSSEQRATLMMVRDTLRGLSYDQALAFYGSNDSTGMPFNLIEQGQDVLDSVERTRIEEYLDLTVEQRALARNQEELARAATTVERNRFAVYDENGEDIIKPYDAALFNALQAQNEADLASIEEINTAWQSEDIHAEIDHVLIKLFSDPTLATPALMAQAFDHNSEEGRALISALTNRPHDYIKDMFKQMPFQEAVNELKLATSWELGMEPLLRTLNQTTKQRIQESRAKVGLADRSEADAVTRLRINEYGAMRQRVVTNLQRLQETKGRPLEATDLNPEVSAFLLDKGFSPNLPFETKVNLVFAASLFTY